ncbi:hypothetical protein FHT82_003824 [Rhizobium sp. BK275]|uniref:hypothetical protein n=1 Tax=unclassified Rhizobium TaxID=2613769 RepID=UPI0016084C15|nr:MULTISPECIES: hypothetical protein [unclassified Rhizobium]MBB3391052.1 hypothetical protein [Rhizobium sp. BK275]MBB3406170.1 hypothetical protein [Rhizobium sp. BK316]
MNAMPSALAEEVAAYLRRGLILIEFISPTPDPYCHDDLVRNVALSDGVYVWDGVLLNWVEKYKVRMPEEFVKHFYASKARPLPVDNSDSPRLLAAFNISDPIMAT